MQIQISWLFQKPTDLDLHCFQRQGISGFSRTSVNVLSQDLKCEKLKPNPGCVHGLAAGRSQTAFLKFS